MSESSGDISFFLPDDLSRCHNCGGKDKKSKLKRCAGCNLVMYCSRECQRQAWPAHRVGCRLKADAAASSTTNAEPSTPEERRAKILHSIGFPNAVSFAHALKDWAEAHRWSFTAITKAIVLLDGGADALHLDTGTPQFMAYTVTANNKTGNGSPASLFRLESIGLISPNEYKVNAVLQKAWEDAEPGRRRMDESYRADGDPAFAGIVSVVYFLKDSGMVIHNQHPVFGNRRPGRIDEAARMAVNDLLALCKGSINAGVSLRLLDESSHTPVPGYMVRVRKTWQWQTIFRQRDDWDTVVRLLPFYVAKSGLLPRAIFDLFAGL